jgi:uncharacterized membrane protein YbhN (UPF0104 family)
MTEPSAPAPAALGRFRRWVAWAVALASVGWMVWAVWTGLRDTAEQLRAFAWPTYALVLALTLVNYSLRFFKWHYLLGRLGVKIPALTDLWIFGSGLAMVISPAKAGEVVKPYLIRVTTGAPLARTLPALVTERVTDGIAVVALAALGVSTFYAEGAQALLWTIGLIAAGLAVVATRPLALALIAAVRWIPAIGHPVADKLAPAYDALRTCVAPVPLAITVLASLGAWFAECVGYWIVLRGVGVHTGLDAATFLYAFSTVAGGPSPGGLGISDALLGGLANRIAGATQAQGLASSLLIRLATLWFGVLLGALALMRIETVIEGVRPAPQQDGG